MSIYATLWCLKFPRYGDDHTGCEWIEVMAQGVAAHVGTSTSGEANEEDPYAGFLPPAVAMPLDDDGQTMRAVVFVTEGTPKGIDRSLRSTSVRCSSSRERNTPPPHSDGCMR